MCFLIFFRFPIYGRSVAKGFGSPMMEGYHILRRHVSLRIQLPGRFFFFLLSGCCVNFGRWEGEEIWIFGPIVMAEHNEKSGGPIATCHSSCC